MTLLVRGGGVRSSSAVTPARSVHKSMPGNVDAVEEMMCAVYMSVTKGA